MFRLSFELQTDPVVGISCCDLQCLLSAGVHEVSSAVLAVEE